MSRYKIWKFRGQDGRLRTIPPDWHRHVLILWDEDDALVPDRERTREALVRISGLAVYNDPIDRKVEGDTSFALYSSGWIEGNSCGLGWVGVLVDTFPTYDDVLDRKRA